MSVIRVGIIGSGQLGRMMALAGTPLNMEFVFFDEATSSPSSRLGTSIQPSKEDALEYFLQQVDVVTYESENTDADLVKRIIESKPVYPGEASLRKSQHRLVEKNTFKELGIRTADFMRVTSKDELIEATSTLGFPVVLKTTTMGYDGKGQAVVKSAADIDDAWSELKGNELIAEAFIRFSREMSVIAVRDQHGNMEIYPLAENHHSDGILRISRIPAKNLSAEKEQQAKQYIQKMAEHLNHVGVLTLELFDTESGLLANEMAPRVHNSGHWTQEGSHCSQFENHVRAISGLPLGNTGLRQHGAAMINIIGKIGDSCQVLAIGNAHLHLYSKTERLNRKLGHINITGNSEVEIENTINQFQSFIDECG